MADERTVVKFGNASPMMQIPVFHPRLPGIQIGLRAERAQHLEQSVTSIVLQEAILDPDFADLTLSTDNDRELWLLARALGDNRHALIAQHLEHAVREHAGGVKPAWIASNDPELEAMLAEFYGCPAGEPTMLLTLTGRDDLHAQHLSPSAQPAAFNYMGLANSAAATNPAATDSTLAGEITTASGGLIRVQGTYSHTAGTNTTTITATFTANTNDVLPVTVSQDALFNAITAGHMAYKDPLNAPAPFNVAGDNLTNTHTITGG